MAHLARSDVRCVLWLLPSCFRVAPASFLLGPWLGVPRPPSSLVFTRSRWAVEALLRSLMRRLFRRRRQNKRL
jgi:hypothetical protein